MYRPMAVIKFASLSETTCSQKYGKHGWVHLWVGELMGPMASIYIILAPFGNLKLYFIGGHRPHDRNMESHSRLFHSFNRF